MKDYRDTVSCEDDLTNLRIFTIDRLIIKLNKAYEESILISWNPKYDIACHIGIAINRLYELRNDLNDELRRKHV